MALKVLETKAVITAQDRTGQTFQAVAAKMKGMETTAARAGDRVRASTWVAQQAASKTALAEKAAAKSRMSMASGGLVAFGAGIVTVSLAAESIARLAQAIGDRGTQRTRFAAAGYTPQQTADIELKSAGLSAIHRGISTNQVMSLWKAAGTTIDPSKVEGAMPDILKTAEVFKIHGKSPEDLLSVIRSVDLQGKTADVQLFTEALDDLAKTVNATSGAIDPREFLNFSMHARGAAPGLSREFLGRVAPSLIQKMGGAEAGTAISSIYQSLVGGTRREASTAVLAKYGLLEPSGEVKGLALAKSNPDRWVNEVMLPGMRAQGVTSKEDIQSQIPKLFQRSTQQQAIGIMATQQADIARDASAWQRAKGKEAADEARKSDPSTIWSGMTTQAGNAFSAWSNNLIQSTGAVGLLGDKFSALSTELTNSKDGAAQTATSMGVLSLASTAAAAALSRFGFSLLARAALGTGAGAAAYGAYQVLKPTPANAMDNEFARQKLYTPEFRSPSPMEKLVPNMSPARLGPGMLSPPDKISVKTKIEGEANLNVKMQIGLDPGLIAREVEKQTSNGMGVSMSP